MLRELWTPAGTAYQGVVSAGRNVETGGNIVTHRFVLKQKDKFGVEHKTLVSIVADEDTSQAHIEEMMGNAAESFMENVRTKYDKRPPTPPERKEIGKALNEFRTRAIKRLQSTNRKIYY
jgi:hypothetical protein